MSLTLRLASTRANTSSEWFDVFRTLSAWTAHGAALHNVFRAADSDYTRAPDVVTSRSSRRHCRRQPRGGPAWLR
jgi:hypothetical protein